MKEEQREQEYQRTSIPGIGIDTYYDEYGMGIQYPPVPVPDFYM